jgi:competence protein ComEA
MHPEEKHMENGHSLIDINRASPRELINLPGVGPDMADRIISGRPYQTVDDLQKVKGLGAKSLETLRSHLTVQADTDETVSSRLGDAVSGFGTRVSTSTQNLIERMENLSGGSLSSTPSSTQVLGIVLISGIISVIFSVILSLAILAGINQTLNIGRHSAVLEMSNQLQQIESQMSDLEAFQTRLDQRLQAVEGLSGRMTSLETEFDQVQNQVSEMDMVVEQLAEQVGLVSEQMGQMVEQVNRFDAFLSGVRSVIMEIFETDGTSVSPEE